MAEKYNIEHLREFIKRCQWRWARSMPGAPHEYIVRGKCALSEDEFYEFFKAQRTGQHERWGKYNNQYIYIDGYKYWTMGDPWETTIIMNRQKVFGEFDSLGLKSMPEYYEKEDAYTIASAVEQLHRPLFEFGCGDGTVAEIIAPQKESYYAVEPSSVLVDAFRSRMKGFSRRISRLSFEEALDKWSEWDGTIIGLFGSPNYVMRPYLSRLGNLRKEVFLMFYKDGYIPEPLKSLHSFNYSFSDLQKMFPSRILYEFKDYNIVSSQMVDWDRAYKHYCHTKDLFN